MIYNNRLKGWLLKQKLVKPTALEAQRAWQMRRKIKTISSIGVCKELEKDERFDIVEMNYKGKDWNFDYLTTLCFIAYGESYRTHYLINK